MKFVRVWWVGFLFFAWFGTAFAADRIPSDALKTINAVNASWVPALEAGNVRGACQGFAHDALFISEDGRVTHGAVAFEAALQKRIDAGLHVSGGKVTSMGAQMVNGQIIEWGDSSLMTIDQSGIRHQGGGYYLAVWSKNKHGVWEITRNIDIGVALP